jgi:uncharacterized protein (DUF2147 family)
MRKVFVLAVVAVAMFCGSAFATDPTGTWLSKSGRTKVRVAPCGASFCGTIVWVADDYGDKYNPDPSLRSRSLVGIQIIYEMKPSGDAYVGRLYNYTDGKSYNGSARLVGPGKLDVSGCVLAIFCKHQIWTKVD